MRNVILFLYTFYLSTLCFADADEINFRGDEYDIYTVNAKDKGLTIFWKDGDGDLIGNFTRLEKYLKKKNKRMLFATNGGIFDKNYTPLGLYVENSTTLTPVNNRKDDGNFYIQPNGVFVIKNNGFSIVATENIREEFAIKYAVQSGPLLVIDNKINPTFRRSSKNFTIRSGVGIDANNHAIFAISNEPVNFYTFAKFFLRKLKCSVALYLDGAISKMYAPKLKRYQSSGKFATLIAVTR